MAKLNDYPSDPNVIRKIVNSQKDFTIDSIRKSLSKNDKRFFTLEQKILALKLLQLNSMDFSMTERQIGVTRKSLYRWQQALGTVAFEAEPEYRIAEKIETSLAMIKSNVLTKSYNSLSNGIDKIDTLIASANSIKNMHAVTEGVLAIVEVLKIEKETVPDQPKANNFFMDIHNLMMANIPSEPTDKSHGNKD
jgi:hypothetical protein